jgi:poly(3-hydroxybutyrate) depolymerase
MGTRATATCREHGLAYDPSVSNGCVLCRRSIAPAPMVATPAASPARSRGWILPALALALAAVAIGGWRWWTTPIGPGRQIPIAARTVTGRTGVAYVPGRRGALPLVVWLHGSNEHPMHVVQRLSHFADRDGFALLLPDSVASDRWYVGDRPSEVTADQTHVIECVHELLARADVQIDPSRVLLVGYSAGGGAAVAFATNDATFSAFAMLHGGLHPGSIGAHAIPGWVSTGDHDTVRPLAVAQQAATTLRGQGMPSVTLEHFPGTHVLFDPEIDALLAWWP